MKTFANNRGLNGLFGSLVANGGATVNSTAATLNAFWEVDLWGSGVSHCCVVSVVGGMNTAETAAADA
jgi:hypothetical protein